MTLLTTWVQTAAARALGWTLFHFLWEGIAIAALLAAALFFLRPARARYLAACLALAAMLVVCVGTFVRVLPDETRKHVATAGRLVLPLAPDSAGTPQTTGLGFHASDLLPWAVPVWFAGVLLLHLRTIAGWMAARRLCRTGVCSAPPRWQESLKTLAAGVRLSKPVALLESCRVDVPLVVGYFRPVILLPLGLLAGMPADQVEAILLHELAHIRRRDYLVNLLQAVAENLLFYHPAVWWISGVIRAERENCCDDLVVAVRGNAHGYATALTALEESRWTGEPALAATGGNLMKRIHRLLDRPEPPHAALTPAFSASLILITAAIALSAWQPKPSPQDPTAQKAESPYRKWMTEDVAYIITNEERATFNQLTTNAEREHFIEQFWLRKDPTPGTVQNEYKQEHYRRIAYTNEKFKDPMGLAGWKTDRGRIYITYGPPDAIASVKRDATTPYPFEKWTYRHLDGIGNDIVVEFTDPHSNGQYRMQMDPHGPVVAEPSIARDSIWPDQVKVGDMRVEVRGLGTFAENTLVEVRIAQTRVRKVKPGMAATVDFRGPLVAGRVTRIDSTAVEGTVGVAIQLSAPPPAGAQIGQQVDATIEIERLSGVVFVGRSVFAKENSTVTLFKIEPDGQHAVKVQVHFGRESVNQIEVLSGLVPGDRVILSDTAQYERFDRIQLH